MTWLRWLERGLATLNGLVAALLALIGISALYVGATGGLLAIQQNGRWGGHEVVMAMGGVLVLVAITLGVASLGMRRQARWRWVAQCSPVLVYYAGAALVYGVLERPYNDSMQEFLQHDSAPRSKVISPEPLAVKP